MKCSHLFFIFIALFLYLVKKSLLGKVKITVPVVVCTYNISCRKVAYWVLSSQRDGAEHDEDQDEIGEDLMVD